MTRKRTSRGTEHPSFRKTRTQLAITARHCRAIGVRADRTRQSACERAFVENDIERGAMRRELWRNALRERTPHRTGVVCTLKTEHTQVVRVVDVRAFAVDDALAQDARERVGRDRVGRIEYGTWPRIKLLQHCDHQRRDREIRARMLLDVEQADLDRLPVEARDRAARVQPLVLQDALRGRAARCRDTSARESAR